VTVRTARIGTRDPDALDVTRKSGGPTGSAFAPSWRLLAPYLDKRRAGALTGADWAEYVERYTEEMRASYRAHPEAWAWLLSRPRIVLTCYCTDPERCHRRVLARILVRLGAEDGGEVGAMTAPAGAGRLPREE